MRIRTTRDLAVRVRARRRELGLSQADAAARAGVSREWLNAFEAGKPTVQLDRVLLVLEALALDLDVGPVTQPSPLDAHLEELRRP